MFSTALGVWHTTKMRTMVVRTVAMVESRRCAWVLIRLAWCAWARETARKMRQLRTESKNIGRRPITETDFN